MKLITKLAPNEVFVFGSNLVGIHGAGAALYAKKHFGAEQGIGVGRTGKCYAIPTKDYALRTLPLDTIKRHIENFLCYATCSNSLYFLITPIGCGLAGYSPKDIAPMFASAPLNCILPPEFIQ